MHAEPVDPTEQERLPQLWGRRGFWQIRLRWAVAPLIIAGVLVGREMGFEFRSTPVVLIAITSPVYNAVFAWIFSRHGKRLEADRRLDRFVTQLEVVADYILMFLLIYFTGGTSSPLVFFFLFHVIIGAIQFRTSTAYQFAGLAAAGLWVMFFGETAGWLPIEPVTFQGEPVHVLDRPVYLASTLIAFTATLFIAAAMVTRIMSGFRGKMADLAVVTAELARLNDKLKSLYAMVAAIGAERHLKPMLDTVTAELATVTDVPGVAVKLLSEDGKTLRYVSAFGLPEALVADAVIDLNRSRLNQRVMEGETLAHDHLGGDESQQLLTELRDLGIESTILAPLRIEDRVIGTLGVYSGSRDYFDEGDTDFLKLAAELVAIAIENVRADEAIENLIQERTRFMLEVAHNLRAPLSAALGMLDLLRDGYLGDVTDKQTEYFQRIDDRLRSLHQTIGELLTIARARDWSREIPDVLVGLAELAAHTERTFRDQSAQKKLRFAVHASEPLPEVDSGSDLLEQVMENLVSNAIKYTPEGGEVEVRFEQTGENEVRISVRDTGIGIPVEEQDHLFREFYRASNAKRLTSSGTGLGLALVKQTVERHGGRLHLASAEGEGTTVVVYLPIRQAGRLETEGDADGLKEHD